MQKKEKKKKRKRIDYKGEKKWNEKYNKLECIDCKRKELNIFV